MVRANRRRRYWNNSQTWSAALSGVHTAYISYFPGLAFPGAVEKIDALTNVAVAADLKRLVLWSGRGARNAQCCEEIVRQSGLEYTLVRAAWFEQNFSKGYLRDPALHGVVALPAGDVREPIVDIDDIVDVAVAALTLDRHAGQLYDVTGSKRLSFDKAAAKLSSAMGRDVRYHSITLNKRSSPQGL